MEPETELHPLEPSDRLLASPDSADGADQSSRLAERPPRIDFTVVPGQDEDGWPWSSWADALYAPNGNIYTSIGDHARPGDPDTPRLTGRSYVYRLDPDDGTIRRVVAFNDITGVADGEYAPGKIHVPLLEADGWIYLYGYRSHPNLLDHRDYPGDPLARYNLRTGETDHLGVRVPGAGVGEAALDGERDILYGLTDSADHRTDAPDRNGFLAYSIADGETLFVGGPPSNHRQMLLTADGRPYYDDGETLYRYDRDRQAVTATDAALPGGSRVRAATGPAADGTIYGISNARDGDGVVFSFDPDTEEFETFGTAFPVGPRYTAAVRQSPGGRYLYYVPGAHGGSRENDAPVVQYDLRERTSTVIAFLSASLREQEDYVVDGTYGLALTPDGSTLHVTLNGQMGSDERNFSTVAVLLIHVPQAEREHDRL